MHVRSRSAYGFAWRVCLVTLYTQVKYFLGSLPDDDAGQAGFLSENLREAAFLVCVWLRGSRFAKFRILSAVLRMSSRYFWVLVVVFVVASWETFLCPRCGLSVNASLSCTCRSSSPLDGLARSMSCLQVRGVLLHCVCFLHATRSLS